MSLAAKLAQLRSTKNCCPYAANYADQPPVNGWIKTYCKVCKKWVGSRPENLPKRRP